MAIWPFGFKKRKLIRALAGSNSELCTLVDSILDSIEGKAISDLSRTLDRLRSGWRSPENIQTELISYLRDVRWLPFHEAIISMSCSRSERLYAIVEALREISDAKTATVKRRIAVVLAYDSEEKCREEAARILSAYDDPEAIEILTTLIDSEDRANETAAKGIAKKADSIAQRPMELALKTHNWSVARIAINRLLVTTLPISTEVCIDVLSMVDMHAAASGQQEEYESKFRKLATRSQGLVPVLIHMLNSSELRSVRLGVLGLGLLRHLGAVPAILALLKRDVPKGTRWIGVEKCGVQSIEYYEGEYRSAFLEALGLMQTDEVVPILRSAALGELEKSGTYIREAAVKGLGYVGTPSALFALREVTFRESDQDVLYHARSSIEKIQARLSKQ